MNVTEINGLRVFAVDAAGPAIGSEDSARDLIGESYGEDIDLFAIPVTRLHPDFLKLATRMAGEFLQKFTNYGYRVAIVGDVSAATLASQALRDFVYESNKFGKVLFVRDMDELGRRI